MQRGDQKFLFITRCKLKRQKRNKLAFTGLQKMQEKRVVASDKTRVNAYVG